MSIESKENHYVVPVIDGILYLQSCAEGFAVPQVEDPFAFPDYFYLGAFDTTGQTQFVHLARIEQGSLGKLVSLADIDPKKITGRSRAVLSDLEVRARFGMLSDTYAHLNLQEQIPYLEGYTVDQLTEEAEKIA